MAERPVAEIKQYWQDQALLHGLSPSASWSDHMVIEMELRELSAFIADGQRILDVGCANGYSTARLAAAKNVSIKGIDYVPEMIASARERIAAGQADGSRVTFEVGDITDIEESDGAYDVVIVTRVLINLGSWDRQLHALKECARVLRTGGLLLLSEATLQGWRRLNGFRREWGLGEIAMPSFNTYLDEAQVIEGARESLELKTLVDFSSTYYVLTRVLKPLLARVAPEVDVADPTMHWNQFAAALPAWGDYGVQKLFVFGRR
jgi:ubiquinone/menaquinone biosynthesis C-methylase UbiE